MCNKTKCFAKNKILLSYFTEAVLLNKIVHLFVNLYQIIIQKNQSQSGQFVLAINWPFFGYICTMPDIYNMHLEIKWKHFGESNKVRINKRNIVLDCFI